MQRPLSRKLSFCSNQIQEISQSASKERSNSSRMGQCREQQNTQKCNQTGFLVHCVLYRKTQSKFNRSNSFKSKLPGLHLEPNTSSYLQCYLFSLPFGRSWTVGETFSRFKFDAFAESHPKEWCRRSSLGEA